MSYIDVVQQTIAMAEIEVARQLAIVCCTTSMYDIQNRCIPYEIDLCYFKICINSTKH